MFSIIRKSRQSGCRTQANEPQEYLVSLETFQGDLVWFGDSTLLRCAREDRDLRSVCALCANTKGLKILQIAGSGYHVEVFRDLLRVARPVSTRRWVVCLNVRSFLPQWQLNPQWHHGSDGMFLPALVGERTLLHTADEYRSMLVQVPGFGSRSLVEYLLIAESSPRDTSLISQRLRFLFGVHYGIAIESANPRIAALRELAAMLEAREAQVLYYFTPLNIDALRRYAHPDVEIILDANLDMLRQAVLAGGASGAEIRNYARAIDSFGFFAPDIPNEHLNERGRKLLAGQITTDYLTLG
jgi:hypothetical protein